MTAIILSSTYMSHVFIHLFKNTYEFRILLQSNEFSRPIKISPYRPEKFQDVLPNISIQILCLFHINFLIDVQANKVAMKI